MTDETVLVDAELLRGMTRDTTLHTLTRPTALIAYGALVIAAVLTGLSLPVIAAADPDRAGTLQWTLPALLALIVASALFTRASTKRAITAAMPSGSVVRVHVGDEKLLVVSKRGVSEVDYSTFRSVHVHRHAVLLRLRGASVVTALPRVLVDDDAVALLRQRIGAAAPRR